MNIADLIKESHATAVQKGWWEPEVRYLNTLNQGYQQVEVERSFGDQIALMHSELSEALEEYRDGYTFNYIYTRDESGIFETDLGSDEPEDKNKLKGKPEGIAVELADILIRIFDTCGKYNIPLEEALKLKLAYNKTRPHRHGGKAL